MAKLTPEQEKQLADLEALRDAPDDDPEDDDDTDDGHVVVLRGSRADSFLSELLGSGKPKTKAKAPAGKPAGKGPAGKPAGKPPAEDDPDDDDPPGDDPPDDDAPPPRANRYFR